LENPLNFSVSCIFIAEIRACSTFSPKTNDQHIYEGVGSRFEASRCSASFQSYHNTLHYLRLYITPILPIGSAKSKVRTTLSTYPENLRIQNSDWALWKP
jgi:hypothetical protein